MVSQTTRCVKELGLKADVYGKPSVQTILLSFVNFNLVQKFLQFEFPCQQIGLVLRNVHLEKGLKLNKFFKI